MNHHDIGWAGEQMRNGKKVYRSGWSGKGIFLYYVPENKYRAVTEIAKKEFGDEVPYKAYIAIKTVDGDVVPWQASETDLLATDWNILE